MRAYCLCIHQHLHICTQASDNEDEDADYFETTVEASTVVPNQILFSQLSLSRPLLRAVERTGRHIMKIKRVNQPYNALFTINHSESMHQFNGLKYRTCCRICERDAHSGTVHPLCAGGQGHLRERRDWQREDRRLVYISLRIAAFFFRDAS